MDLNGDGNIDLLSAGYSGFNYVLYGNNDGSFNEAIIIKDKSGADITLGRFYNFKTRKYITLGKEENEGRSNFVKAHDWDNDGDFDLIISADSVVKLRINEGTKKNPEFSTRNIEILPVHYADAMIDWDGDGLWDILCGSKKGGVYFYKNTGKLGSPSFGKAECLLKSSEFINKNFGIGSGITQLAVADYNNDGKLDLIIGNQNMVDKPLPEFSADQIKRRDILKTRLDEIKKMFAVYRSDREKMKEARNNKNSEYSKLRKESAEIYKEYRKFIPGPKMHGNIWVSLRK